MDTQIKNRVGYAVVFALVMTSVASLWYVNTYNRVSEPSSFRSFSVSADGKATVIPDVAEFTFEVITEGGQNLTESQTENTKKTNDAIAFVKSKGVDAKDIKTQNYNVEPRYQYFNCSPTPVIYSEGVAVSGGVSKLSLSRACPPPEIVGYTVRQVVSVKVRKFDAVGDILSGVVENGANSVSQLSFTVDDPTMVENEARAQALMKAKEKAKAMADAGGFRLGRLLNISEGGIGPYYDNRLYIAEGFGKGGDGVAVPAPSIEPGSQEFRVTMMLTYEIR
ncbi:MAG: hypothetical protein G01um101429_363 [Parcubacteria group bacterium Gr01-1014_29]|nr:MAG: hypothetical protein G01um101429_363 [Parcubacteria group bacterium Gr01-1014_29]